MDGAERKYRYQVIDGGGLEPPSEGSKWQTLPQIVPGRSPFDKATLVGYRLGQISIKKALESGRRQPLFDAMCMIVGQPPGVPNISRWTRDDIYRPLTPFAKAHACFRGLKRPIGEDDRGFDTFAFITKPEWTFEAVTNMVCVAEPYRIPPDLVFVTYVRLDQPARAELYEKTRQFREFPVKGMITHWGLVECDPTDPLLPIGHGDRYRRKMW
ncbi:hypothetical protein [Aurantimonas sp. A3-2-R12]|uniref:hypothetical protein n=1 Tax=Aurantimonas sp. A3-2-R12 TaxID=3114362 RepID=UPI002E19AAC6|nr:hypothetical protein [Aurantimonas sp. A3-2-R12]